MKMNRKDSIKLAIGLLVLNSDFVLNHFFMLNDFYTGLLKGIGITIIFTVLIVYGKHKRLRIKQRLDLSC